MVRLFGLLFPCVRIHVGESSGLAIYAARGDYAGGAFEEARRGKPGIEPASAACLLDRAMGVRSALRVDVPVGVLGAARGLA